MRTIPVDTSNRRFLIGGPIKAATDDSGAVRNNPEGRPLFLVPVVVVAEDTGAETFTVRVPGPIAALPVMTEVKVGTLSARPWNMNGRSGVSFSADSITPAKSA
jgi:hypothetical protein